MEFLVQSYPRGDILSTLASLFNFLQPLIENKSTVRPSVRPSVSLFLGLTSERANEQVSGRTEERGRGSSQAGRRRRFWPYQQQLLLQLATDLI